MPSCVGTERDSCESKDGDATQDLSTQHKKCAGPQQKSLVISTRQHPACLRIQSTDVDAKVNWKLGLSDEDFQKAIIKGALMSRTFRNFFKYNNWNKRHNGWLHNRTEQEEERISELEDRTIAITHPKRK